MSRFTFERIIRFANELQKAACIEKIPLEGFVYKACDYKKDNCLPEIDHTFSPFSSGMRWGGRHDSHYWFYKKIKTHKKNLYFHLPIAHSELGNARTPQFMAYLNGTLMQALDVNHTLLLLPEEGEYELYLYAYTGMDDKWFEFEPVLVEIDEACQSLYFDLKVPLDVCAYLNKSDIKYQEIVNYLNHAVNLVDFRSPYSDMCRQSIQKASHYLWEEFYGKYCGNEKKITICIGHTHIDVAWLWTLRQTREKAVRSFSTVVKLMESYPKYRFMTSQPQLLKYVKEEAPELYTKIKALVKEGRFELEGAMWVEADCNLISGESMIRQILFGKRFFQDEFGVDSKILWLPDVFGYSAAMPQILKGCGVDTFVTSKISWNETNQMPHDTFLWQGIDGTEIFTYFLTAQDKKRGEEPTNYATYNAAINSQQVAGAWERYQDKMLTDEVLLTFGYGDGGGGPTMEMLEHEKRLNCGIPGCPKAEIDTVTNFFSRLKEHAHLAKWVGELYLELHRGTYTSIAKNKRNNRKCEFLFHNAELSSVISYIINQTPYPQDIINHSWEAMLTNQFHDVLPGSSIHEVYEDCDSTYAEIFDAGNQIHQGNLNNIADKVNTEGGIFVFNGNSFACSDVVWVDKKPIYVDYIPPLGYRVVQPASVTESVTVSEFRLENESLLVDFNEVMQIKRIYDKKAEREVLKPGECGNVLQAFEDLPRNWDAWEISDYFEEKSWVIDSIENVSKIDLGVVGGFCIKRRFMDSMIEQKVLLKHNSSRIDFETKILWNQEHILLKALFPVDILSSSATYDIQFGTVERPTHRNTSWDEAKFELCAHKFADLSEHGYGVSLLSDCKYGYDIKANNMRITLLKCGTYPNPIADKGEHYFTYSLYPHTGDYREGKTAQEGYLLNNPLQVNRLGKQTGTLPEQFSFASCNCDNIVIETVKKEENGNGVLLRLYENYGRRGKVCVSFGLPVKSAFQCNMLEHMQNMLSVSENSVELFVKPFEIITLLLHFDNC